MTRFSANKPILNTFLYLIMLPWQRHIRQLNYQKGEVCVVNLLPCHFGDQRIEGFREKGKRNRGITLNENVGTFSLVAFDIFSTGL